MIRTKTDELLYYAVVREFQVKSYHAMEADVM